MATLRCNKRPVAAAVVAAPAVQKRNVMKAHQAMKAIKKTKAHNKQTFNGYFVGADIIKWKVVIASILLE